MKTKQRILVVDDEEDLRNILQLNLENAGYEVQCASSAEQALQCDLARIDLMLLDIMMDGMSGLQLAQAVRGNTTTSQLPIIFLTALDGKDDMLQGFDVGADDYISKPFLLAEVLSRVRAVLRRTAPVALDIAPQGIHVDNLRKVITIDGEVMDFTPIEYGMMQLFLDNPLRVFSRQELLDRVWCDDVTVVDRAVDVCVMRLRKKLGRHASLIVTRQGFGYYYNNKA